MTGRVRTAGAALLLAAGWAAPRVTAAQAGDTAIAIHRQILPRQDAWLLLGFTAGVVAARPLDRSLTRRLQRSAVQANGFLSGGATAFRVYAFPGAGIAGGGFYLAGLARHDRTMSEVALHGMEAVVATQAIVTLGKGIAGRARPLVDPTNPHDYKLFRGFHAGDDYQSFPSGHAAAAFAIAGALTAEATDHKPRLRRLVALTTYTAAGFTGLSRMYDNKHWASDVVAGAAVGTLTGMTVVRYNHRHPNNFLDERFLPRHARASPAVTALVAPADGGLAVGVSLSMR
ncbi:MAG: phosphoesterase PA-phosphatase related protein [Gemmatimonadetes bacterium]|nr:phosphoesterase PA-phosphatase related protein [Gemmatimonadota bacterium]